MLGCVKYSKTHHKCPHKGKKKAAVRSLEVNAESQTSEFEPVWGYEIDSDDEVYELISDYSDDSDSSEDDSKDITFEEQSSNLQRIGIFMQRTRSLNEYPRNSGIGLEDVHEKPVRVALSQSLEGELVLSNDEWLRKVRNLAKWANGKYNYVQLGAVQIRMKGLFRGGMNVPVQVALLDRRWLTFGKALVGGFHANLAMGDAYRTVKPRYMVSLQDPNLKRIMVLRIHTSGLEDLMASSDGIAIQYRLIYRLINSVKPIRMNSSANTEVHGPGKDSVILIRPMELDNEVEVTLPTPRNSGSLERNKEVQPFISRKNILETDDTASDAGSSNSRKIVGYKSVQILIYEE
ncbi:uncharacterized protein LOC116120140 [Pistacia vera]|uniref:uncharacterized protein LOC116120140 n=1 Tax=Pistacia vera TaxID=55513 RepID=UPI0012630BF8|nr:uncharacterized protein LOC116120140 [Pistacia vera]